MKQFLIELGKKTVYSVIITVLAIVIFMSGYQQGVDRGKVTVVELGEERVKPDKLRIDGYGFHIRKESNDLYLDGITIGYTWSNGTIVIESNMSVTETYKTCVHEKLHNIAQRATHEWVYEQEDSIVDSTCLKLLTLMETKG